MSENENLVRNAEGLLLKRKILMGVIILGLIGICGTMLTKHLDIVALDHETSVVLRNLGLGLVTIGILGNVMIRRKIINSPDLKTLIDDERSEHAHKNIFAYGYFALMAGIVISIILSVTGILDHQAAFLIMLLIGGITPPFMFIINR